MGSKLELRWHHSDVTELVWYLGLGLAGVVLLQGLGAAAGAAVRARRAGRVEALKQTLLIGEIEAARARARAAAETPAAWAGWRVFEVAQRVDESGGICSLYLQPHDRKPLPPFKPGQYLTFQFRVPGADKPVVRCYSLSDAHDANRYRVSIKRVLPSGLVSNFVHDQIKDGALVDVRAPSGHFFLDLDARDPVVLLAGGVGITPLLAMVNALVKQGARRETWLFYGMRQPDEALQRAHLEALAREHEWLSIHLCFSDHQPTQGNGPVHEHHSRVGVDVLEKTLPSNNYQFYICGPPPMMQSLTEGLAAWGVPDQHVHFEAFGPASVKRAAPAVAATTGPEAQGSGISVTFHRSSKSAAWTPATGSLLDLAEQNGISIDSGCRAGNCGTCLVAIRSGEVSYTTSPGYPTDPGTCLACVAKPKGAVVLEA